MCEISAALSFQCHGPHTWNFRAQSSDASLSASPYDPDLIVLHFHHRHGDIRPNHQRLAPLSRQNPHLSSPSSGRAVSRLARITAHLKDLPDFFSEETSGFYAPPSFHSRSKSKHDRFRQAPAAQRRFHTWRWSTDTARATSRRANQPRPGEALGGKS